MNDGSAHGLERPSRLLIPDNTPLSLLAMIGEEALDWLFVPGAEVWVTDMVRQEAIRDPDPDDDRRPEHRAALASWLDRNRHRVRIQLTDEGEEYRKAMATWQLAGNRPDLKPSWKGRGGKSILQVMDAVEKVLAAGEAVVTIVDDARARAAIRLTEGLDIDLMATESFLTWLHQRFHVEKAATAWMAITIAARGKAPDAPEEDPVYVRKA